MFEGMFQPMHLLIVAGIALLFLGPRKLPELGKGLGEGIQALKAGLRGASQPPLPRAQDGSEEHVSAGHRG